MQIVGAAVTAAASEFTIFVEPHGALSVAPIYPSAGSTLYFEVTANETVQDAQIYATIGNAAGEVHNAHNAQTHNQPSCMCPQCIASRWAQQVSPTLQLATLGQLKQQLV